MTFRAVTRVRTKKERTGCGACTETERAAHMSTPGEMDTRIHPSIHFSHDLLYWVATFNQAFIDILQQSIRDECVSLYG